MVTVVAGGAGFVGSHLCERLVRDLVPVVCLDNLVTGNIGNLHSLLGNPLFTFIRHDIVDELPSLDRVDRIYHLASPASPPAYQRHPIATMRVNGEGTRRLLDLARARGARFLFASTSEIYGDPLVHPQSEEYRGNVSSTGPRSMYDEAKRYGEALTMAYANEHAVETRLVRIFNTYGPRLSPDDGRVVSTFVAQALRGEPLTIFGDGTQTRSFQYVDDLIEGLMRAMEGMHPGPINLGNPEEYTMHELASLVHALVGCDTGLAYRPLPGDDPRQRRPDIDLAWQVLGWKPVVSVQEGLARTIDYFRDRHPVLPVDHVPSRALVDGFAGHSALPLASS